MNHMYKKHAAIVVALLAGTFLLLGTLSHAANDTPPIPLTTPIPAITPGGAPTTQLTGPASYIKTIYTFGTGFGMLLAVAMIIVGAIEYTVSEVITNKEEAMERIRSAVIGLLMLLAANAIIYVINPKLLELKEPSLTDGANPGGTSPVINLGGGTVTNLAVGAVGTKKTLGWAYTPPPENPTFEIGYRTESFIGKAGEEGWNTLAGGITATSYALPGTYVSPGTSYEFRVRAGISGANGQWSNTATIVNAAPPSLTVTAAGTSLTFSWTYTPQPGETVKAFIFNSSAGKASGGGFSYADWKNAVEAGLTDASGTALPAALSATVTSITVPKSAISAFGSSYGSKYTFFKFQVVALIKTDDGNEFTAASNITAY